MVCFAPLFAQKNHSNSLVLWQGKQGTEQMANHLFMLGAVVTAIVQALSFWVMSWRKGVLRSFGRTPLTWGSLTYLSASAFVPFLCVLPILYFNESILTFDPEVEAALLVAAINMAGMELTKRLGNRIVAPKTN
jgi:hypothetical protein